MMASGKLPRREVLKSLVPLSLMAGLSLSAGPSGAGQISSDARILVACFSRTGNTRVIAGQIGRALGADLFEIQPAEAYPEDYEATVSQAQRERDTGYEPPLNREVWNISGYQVGDQVLSFRSRFVREDPRAVHHAWRLWDWAKPRRRCRACTARTAHPRLLQASRPGAGNTDAGNPVASGPRPGE
jgi:hypothetical protein